MGMAASQARYLALVARKSNCEYEGQQINQSRLILSNVSANLFTQMLGLEVPIAPSKEDFSTLQYSFEVNGIGYTMDKWVPLSEEDSDGGYFNYAVTYHYNKDVEQGTQKIKGKPQVGFSGAGPTGVDEAVIKEIETKLLDLQDKAAKLEKARNEYNSLREQANKLEYYIDSSFNNITSATQTGTSYTISNGTDTRTYNQYSDTAGYANTIKKAVQNLIDMGALKKSAYQDENGDWYEDNLKEFYYDTLTETIARQQDIDAVKNGYTILNVYYPESTPSTSSAHGIQDTVDLLKTKRDEMEAAQQAYDTAERDFNALSVPNSVGNIELVPLAQFNDTQLADVKMIIADMEDQGIECNMAKCFQTDSGLYNNDTYAAHGGIYTYEQNGITYYTTYYDLVNSYLKGTGINHKEDQAKLPTYCIQTVTIPINTTEKAVLETDAKGRFTSIRTESDSATYTLKSEKSYDDIAYDDAMNQYDYQKALYDKRISDLNAETSLIHQQDQDLELRLKQLDTEQNALSTEIDAVSKVVKDNIEKSFKTFGG